MTPVLMPPPEPDVYEVQTGRGRIYLGWNHPYDPTITKYQVRRSRGRNNFNWTGWSDIEGSGAETTYHTVYGLAHGSEYRFRIRAVNARGTGSVSDEFRATTDAPPVTVSAPALQWARVNGAELGMRFDKALDESSVPAGRWRGARAASPRWRCARTWWR